MAQLDMQKIKKIEKFRNTIHEKVLATYSVFTKDEVKYFQIDTYGKEDRQIPEKISQSIQIDQETAQFLVDLLRKEFDLS